MKQIKNEVGCLLAIVTTITLLLFSRPLQAQPEKGTRVIGGLLRIDNTENVANSQLKNAFSIELTPTYSVFISDKVALGGRVGYAYTQNYSTTNTKTFTSVTNAVPISIFAQYYHWLTPQLALTARGGASYRLGFITDTERTVATQRDTITLSTTRSARLFVSPSLVWMPSPKIGIELGMSGIEYGNDARLDKNGQAFSSTNVFRLNVSPSLTTGIYYFF